MLVITKDTYCKAACRRVRWQDKPLCAIQRDGDQRGLILAKVWSYELCGSLYISNGCTESHIVENIIVDVS